MAGTLTIFFTRAVVALAIVVGAFVALAVVVVVVGAFLAVAVLLVAMIRLAILGQMLLAVFFAVVAETHVGV